MRLSWLAPLVLFQALVGPPAEQPTAPCADLPPVERDRCEAELRQERTPIPPPRKLRREGQLRTGQEFDSSRTFTGKEEGSPGY